MYRNWLGWSFDSRLQHLCAVDWTETVALLAVHSVEPAYFLCACLQCNSIKSAVKYCHRALIRPLRMAGRQLHSVRFIRTYMSRGRVCGAAVVGVSLPIYDNWRRVSLALRCLFQIRVPQPPFHAIRSGVDLPRADPASPTATLPSLIPCDLCIRFVSTRVWNSI